MKVTIILLVLFVATKQISSEEKGKYNVSNETIASNNETAPTSVFKNIANFFNNIIPNRKKYGLAFEGKNTTANSSIEDLLAHNTTQNHFENSSIPEVNSTVSIVKLEEIGSNTTNENVSTAIGSNTANENGTEYENKKISNENSTKDDLSIYNATREQEDFSKITPTPQGPNLHTIREVSNSNTIDKSTKIYPDLDLSTSDKDVTIPQELNTYDRTEISTEIPTLDPQRHQNDCESYIKKLLTATFAEHGDQLDPLILEDRKITIENSFLLPSPIGEVGLYDGKITGTSKAISFSECDVQLRGDQLRLRATISFDEVELGYKGRATFLEFGPKFTVDGKLSGSLVELQIIVPKDGGIGEVKSLRVRNLGRMKVDVKELGPINWHLGLISEDIARVFSFNFRRSIEKEFRKALEEEIKKINYP